MNKAIVSLIITSGLMVTALAAALWWSANSTTNPYVSQKLTVGATIFPLADIVRNVAGPKVDVVQIIPTGASPHSFAIQPQQAMSLTSAKVLFYIGQGLDNYLLPDAQAIAPLSPFEVSANINLLPNDPHYWLTVPNAMIIATNVANELKRIDPDEADTYNQYLAEYLQQLQTLEKELQDISSNISQRYFISAHDAWQYFTKQYHLELAAAYEPTPGEQPSLQDLKRLGEIIKEKKITTFFAEPQEQSAAATRIFEKEYDLKISALDPEGSSLNDSYINLMKYNVRAIADASSQSIKL